jgi:hypothetical protein
LSLKNIIQLYQADEKMNFNPISSAKLELNYKDLTVGFHRIPVSIDFIVGNEKGQIYKVAFLKDKMKFGEM